MSTPLPCENFTIEMPQRRVSTGLEDLTMSQQSCANRMKPKHGKGESSHDTFMFIAMQAEQLEKRFFLRLALKTKMKIVKKRAQR